MKWYWYFIGVVAAACVMFPWYRFVMVPAQPISLHSEIQHSDTSVPVIPKCDPKQDPSCLKGA